MKPKITLPMLMCFASLVLQAQVSEIKERSTGRSRSVETSSGGSSSTGSFGGAFVAEIAFQSFQLFGVWQEATLKKRAENENIVSLDLYLQTGIQPSSYYIVHPRLRANWGLFSTDFRFNYLIEEGVDGVEYLRTDDWQILQLNVLSFNNATFRVGGGILHEDFSGGKTFPEWTVAFQLQNNNRRVGGVVEYRTSEPRQEFSSHVQLRLVGTERFHVYGTGGLVFQRYYHTINVWGMQTGLMFRIN